MIGILFLPRAIPGEIRRIVVSRVNKEVYMAASKEKTNKDSVPDAIAGQGNPRRSTIDVGAEAGSNKSLGAESVRDGRPSSDDSTVEAMDEETPGHVA
jgi:hypothetical protein